MASNDTPDDNSKFHLEGGVPVFNTRLEDIEREQAEAKKRDKEYKEEQLRLDRRMVWFTGLLVVCTAIVGAINGWQAQSAKKSATAANDSAGQAKAANDINVEALHSVQRAFVSLHHLQYERVQDPDHADKHVWNISAVLENGGTTNARHVVGMVEIRRLQQEPTDQRFKGDYLKFPLAASQISGKGGRIIKANPVMEPSIFGVDLGQTITPETAKRTHVNRDNFIWGWVYYLDVFKNTKPHITEFCTQVIGAGYVFFGPTATATAPINFVYSDCVEHNCEDEDCKNYAEIVALAQAK